MMYMEAPEEGQNTLTATNPIKYEPLVVHLKTKYVDDVPIGMVRFRPGVRWDQDKRPSPAMRKLPGERRRWG